MNKKIVKTENQNILLASNGSKAARNACFYALETFKEFSGDFFLINAYRSRILLGSPKEKEGSLHKLDEELKLLKQSYPNLNVKGHSSSGSLAHVIKQFSKKIKGGLLIIGRRRSESWFKTIFGRKEDS